jgi:5-methylcytosine-specific restriction endonuclease McrA
MNLKNLSDSDLLSQTQSLVRRERELLSEILHHLREIERRRLFAQLGFKSLFDYATKKLGYADDQAARRISAMRLLIELPEIECKIADGSLTLTNIGMAQALFRHEKKKEPENGSPSGFNKDEKLKLLLNLEHKSKREAEKIIVSRATEPALLKPDRIRTVTTETIEIKFIANCELQKKLEKVKGLLAHSYASASLADTVNALCDLALKALDPAAKAASRPSNRRIIDTAKPTSEEPKPATPAPALKRRITCHVRRAVWHRANSKCQNCGSVHALQVDHRQPFAMGGGNEPENLRLLCRSCNQRAAINKLGITKMQRYFNRPVDG